jgi:CRP/FNR family cyclic AMP-dependent transcriptional regulator
MALRLCSGGSQVSRRPLFDLDAFTTKYGGVTISKYEKNQVVYAQGTPASSLFYIMKGEIALAVVSNQGKERVIGVLNPHDFFGEGCLSDQSLRNSSAKTMSDCVVARLEKSTVTRAIHEDVRFSEFFASYFLWQNKRLKDDVIDLLFSPCERRLARILVTLANFEDQENVLLPITNINQETLAKMVGTTRSRINVFMNKFRRLGYIDYDGTINVRRSLLDSMLLRDASSTHS